MAKKETNLETIKKSYREEQALLDECQQHEADSYKWLSTKRDTWDDKESMLVCGLEDQISGDTKSQVFDPVLSTIVFERGARVMAQNPSGKAFAVSKNDVGKNLLMNLLLKFFRNNANEHYSHLVKLRMLDIYSSVYGSFFALVPWRIDERSGYIGPELTLIPIRDIRPQPGKKCVGESDWFGIKSAASLSWLLEQQKAFPNIWRNVDSLATEIRSKKSEGDTQRASAREERSYIEREWWPSLIGDTKFPSVDIVTEYRSNAWITWAPKQVDPKTSRPWILRIVENPYPEGLLPIVEKHAFPLLDSIIGLGEFERGQTLQFAINSLINLYLDGVKYSIFPPLHINPDNVVASSIKWGSGERWYMNNPNKDVQPMVLSPQGLQTFQSTYGFMLAAVHNLTGSTQVTKMEGVEPAAGKTPEAIKYMSYRESARDEWDRFMMENTIDQIYTRWISLITHNLEKSQALRIFGDEVGELQKIYKKEKILEIFESGKRGNIRIDRGQFVENGEPVTFDFELELGSTMKKNIDEERAFLGSTIAQLISQPRLLEEIRAKGKDIDIGELFKRWLITSGVKDWDKIILEPEQLLGEGETREAIEQAPIPQGQPAQIPRVQFNDSDIAAAAQQIFGGVSGIPASR
jgi:hypothetical protein